jgi:hypothetical protein
MAKFVYLKESKNYLNLDQVATVKIQEESSQGRAAEVLLAGIERPEIIAGGDVDALLLELNKEFDQLQKKV